MKYLVAAISLFSSSAFAIENIVTVCTHGGQERKIEVVYSSDMATPCEVQYTKTSGTQVLWKAQSEVGFCEQKASTLVEKQIAWGWQCDIAADVEPAAAEGVEPEVIESQAEELQETEPASESETITEAVETVAEEAEVAPEPETLPIENR